MYCLNYVNDIVHDTIEANYFLIVFISSSFLTVVNPNSL